MLNATEQKLIERAKSNATRTGNYVFCVVHGNATSRKANNSFGLREKNAAFSLVKKGIVKHIPDNFGLVFELISDSHK
jgi:hypothetical protein